MKEFLSLLFAVMLVTLAGCSSEPSANNPDTPAETAVVDMDGVLKSEHFDFSILSADTRQSFKNALGMEYMAAEGYEFVIVFFNATNTADDTQNVMNTNFNSYVDDTKLTIQTVVGEVDGYMPLLGAVSAGKTFEGYTVWEVPEGWSELDFSYIDALTGSESEKYLVVHSSDISE